MTPETVPEPPPPPEIPQEPAWLRRLAISLTVGGLIVGAFFIGRYTAAVDNIRPTGACTDVHKAFKDLNTTAGWEIVEIRRAQQHLIADHPACYDAGDVAKAKTLLEMAQR